MTLPELAIKRHVTTLMILVSLVVLGTVALVRLPLAFMPDIEQPQLFIVLPYQNASPEQVERMVVRPAEDALGSVKGLKSMWSMCSSDGGRIRLEFDWSTDLDVARVEIREKLDRIRRDLPDDLGDIRVSNHWDDRDADSPILEGRLSSNRDLSESYDLLLRRIAHPLERIPGVAQVRLDGVSPKEVRINLELSKLEFYGVDVREVVRKLRTSNFDMSLGRITEGDDRYTVRTLATFTSVEEIRNLVIRPDGLKLREIADVRYEQPPLEYGRHLDGRFAIGIEVTQEAKANTVDVSRALRKRIAEMKDDPELKGVNFLVWFDQGEEIEKTLRDLTFTGIFGAVLASLVLFLFLRRVGSTLIAVLCIPFSLIVTCGIIWAMGHTLNTLTLLGLIVGVGMLVDNAVVVMENIFRHREMGDDQKTAARRGASEVSTAVIAATLTSVIVFLPLIFNKPSEMNIYLRELGITVCITLLASLFISQTLIPMATSWFVRGRPRPKGRVMSAAERRYASMLAFNLRHRWMTPLIGLLVVASAVYPYLKVDKNFDASQTELFVGMRYTFSEDMSLPRKEEVVRKVEEALEPHRRDLKVRSIYSFWSDRFTLTRLYLEKGAASEENLEKVKAALPRLLPRIAGVKVEVQENRQHWRMDRGKRVAFQIVGEDSAVLARLAEEAKERLRSIDGLADPFSSNDQGGEEIHVELDRELLSRYGVSPAQAAEVVGLTYRGRRLPRYRTPDGEREMRLTLDEQRVESVDQLGNLPIWNEEGVRIPLASMAALKTVSSPERIQRDNRLTSLWVGARYRKGKRQDYLPKVRSMLESMDFPYGYHWTFGRWQQRQKEKSREFLVNLLLALLLVFAVMAGIFESVRQAISLMVALPFALAGAVWTLYLSGTDFDQPAAVGLLLLIGIVVNNGIVMLEHINSYRRRGMARREAMLKGGTERLRPILMTALTTLLGLVPIVMQKPSLGGVYYYSMALVIMGGLLVSTFLTTILLPTTVTLAEDFFAALAAAARNMGSWLVRRAMPIHESRN